MKSEKIFSFKYCLKTRKIKLKIIKLTNIKIKV